MSFENTQKKPIAAFDIDGTLFRGTLFEKLLIQLAKNNYLSKNLVSKISNLFKERDEKIIPYRVYETELVKIFLVGVKGLPQSTIVSLSAPIVSEALKKKFVFPSCLLETLRISHDCIAITGALREIADALANCWGFDACFASEIEVVAGRYTDVIINRPARDKKIPLFTRLKFNAQSTLTGSVAIGDTLSDLKMLELTEKPIVFNPDCELVIEAKKRNWPIVLERKNVIYVIKNDLMQLFELSQVNRAVHLVLSEYSIIQ